MMHCYLSKSVVVFVCLVMLVAGCQGTPGHDESDESVTVIPANGPPIWEENDDPTPAPTMADSPLSQANQADSPLALPVTPIPAHLQGLVQYRGFSIYGEMSPPFEVWYDPEIWELHEEYTGPDYTLVHRHLLDCELWLQAGPGGGTERIATVQLADREWNMFLRQPTRLSYSTLYENLAFLFGLSLAEEFSPDVKSPCQEAAEAVIDTFVIVTEAGYDPETPPESLLSPPIDGFGESSSTTSSTPADLQPLVKYRGFNAYGEEYPQFEVWYDPESWELFEKYDGYSDALIHLHIPGCELLLQDGPRGIRETEAISVELADRTWVVRKMQPTVLSYASSYENLAFLFRMFLPDAIPLGAQSPCQEAAEAVIDTFVIVAAPAGETPATEDAAPIPSIPDSPLSPPGQADSPSELSAANPDPSLDKEWTIYTSIEGGYSFEYPITYTVHEYERGHIILHPAREDAGDVSIALMYLHYDMGPTTDLLEWAKLYDFHHKEGAYELEFSPAELDDSSFGAESSQLYVESTATSVLPLQAFLLTNGKLVLRISTNLPSDSQSPFLQDIAQSIRFSAAAPQDMAQLYDPDPPPLFPSLHEYIRFNEELELVNQALDIRMHEGRIPTEILEQLSELARRRYENSLEAQADIVQELDRLRVEQSQTAATTQEAEQAPDSEASGETHELPHVLDNKEIFFVTASEELPVEYRLWQWQVAAPIPMGSVVVAEEYGYLEVSWHGQAIAYTIDFNGDNLWLVTLEDGHTRQVLSPEFLAGLPPGDAGPARLFQFEWLPDVSGILFNTRQPTYGQKFSDDLHFIDRLSGEIRTVFPAGEGGLFEFSPDGRWLAVVSPGRIQLLSAATLEVLNTFDYPGVTTYSSYSFYAPLLWLEDSSGVVATIPPPEGASPPAGIQLESDGLTRLWQIPADGTEPQAIAVIPFQGDQITVSPNLRHVIYSEVVELREPQQDDPHNMSRVRVYYHDLETGTVSVLYEGFWPILRQWWPDGESLLIRVPDMDPPWQRVDVAQNEWQPWPFAMWPLDSSGEQWLDDEHFLFRAGGGEELWLGNTEGEQWLLFRAEALIRNYQVVP